MKLLFPLFGLLIGIGAGVGTGVLLSDSTEDAPIADDAQTEPLESSTPFELVSLDSQFVVPIVEDNAVIALVILSLGLEVAEGTADVIYTREAKLRDVFLRTLFRHANIGGFGGDFTSLRNLDMLRSSLLSSARTEIGPNIQGVLIMSLAKQSV